MAKAQGNLSLFAKLVVQSQSKNRLCGLREIDRTSRPWIVCLLEKWRTIVKEDSVKVVLHGSVQGFLFQVRKSGLKGRFGYNFRVCFIFERKAGGKPAKEESAVDQNSGWH
jgi:hypothetical protein